MNEGFGFRLIAILILAVCIVMLSARVYKLQEEVDRLRKEWDEFIEEIFYLDGLTKEQAEDMERIVKNYDAE